MAAQSVELVVLRTALLETADDWLAHAAFVFACVRAPLHPLATADPSLFVYAEPDRGRER